MLVQRPIRHRCGARDLGGLCDENMPHSLANRSDPRLLSGQVQANVGQRQGNACLRQMKRIP
jgi:hypothetical protein